MRVFANWYYSQIRFNIYFQQSLEFISFCITASFDVLILSMQCYTKRRRKGDGISKKRSRENEEYTWINLSAREALSYKTKISTKDSRDKPEDSLKHTKRISDCFTEEMQCSFPLQKCSTAYRLLLTFRVEKEHCMQTWVKKLQISW